MRAGFLTRRLAQAAITVALIVIINFLLFRAMPGSPERVLLGRIPNITPEVLQAVRERWGLDRPVFPDQFIAYIGATIRGDLGFSFLARGQTVVEVIGQRLWPTLLLFGVGEILAIVFGLIGAYSILMRSSIIDTRTEDYITTARAKGLPDARVLRAHAVPNALLPMITLVAINLGYVIAGAVTAEVVFSWPGLGTLAVEALGSRDYPVLQGVFLLLAISVVIANLVADLVYGLLDPRVRT